MNEFDRNADSAAPRPDAAAPATGKPVSSHPGLIGRLRNYFLTGLVLVAPVYITIALTWWFINWVDDLVRPFFPLAYRPETYLPGKIPGLGLIVGFVVLTLLGFLTANFVGRKLVEVGENLMNRLPVIRPVCNSRKQMFATMLSKAGSRSDSTGLSDIA